MIISPASPLMGGSSAALGATSLQPSQTAAPTAATPAGITAGADAGSVGANGGGFNLKQMLLYGTAGAILGVIFPVIPGGPIGGALIGAALSAFF